MISYDDLMELREEDRKDYLYGDEWLENE